MPEESSPEMSSAVASLNCQRPDDRQERFEDEDDEDDDVEILNDEGGQTGSNGVKIQELSD